MDTAATIDERAPVMLLIGFLGAGKTTLLNHILRGDHGLRVGVLVNDFGAVNIDAQLVVGVEESLMSLSNGCICCSIRDDLLAATRAMLERPHPPEYLIVEASGVSEPVAVALTFISPALRPLVRLDSIIAVVDAEHAGTAHVTDEMVDLMQDQVAVADIVVINKIDLVDEVRRAEAQAWVRTVARRAHPGGGRGAGPPGSGARHPSPAPRFRSAHGRRQP